MHISENAVQNQGDSNELNIWYDKGPLCSYNALFSFALGARGTGKTYAFKTWALKSNNPFIWIRRVQEDIDNLLKDNATEFTKDLYLNGWLGPDDEIKISGNNMYINGILKFYFIPLSLSRRSKSHSYADVNIMVYDEVFEGIGNKKYLKDEVELFLDLYETVNRLRLDGRPEVRAFFLSNNVSFTNPYFATWGIEPFEGRIKTFLDGLIVVEQYKNEEFAKLKRQTKFGKLVGGTKYGDYAIENEIWLDDNAYLAERPPKSLAIAEIHYKEQYIGVWNGHDGYIYCAMGRAPAPMTFGIKYACLEGEFALTLGSYPLKQLKKIFEHGKLRFDSNITKSIMHTLLQTAGQS